MEKIKQLSDENDAFRTRSHRKCCRTVLARIVALIGVVFAVIMMIIFYHVIVLDKIEKLRHLETLNTQHHSKHLTNQQQYPKHNIQLLKVSGPNSIDDDEEENLNEYDQSLDVQHLRAKFSHHRHTRFATDQLDPVFMQHEPNFDSLYAKVRNKRTRLELSKLEREYFRCKKESINSSGCMMAFAQLYALAKEISEKMDKMKHIFNENEEVLGGSKDSQSVEFKENVEDSGEWHKVDANGQLILNKTTEGSFGGDAKNASASGEDKHIHYSWIIDGPGNGEAAKEGTVTTDCSTAATTGMTPAETLTTKERGNETDGLAVEDGTFKHTKVMMVVDSEPAVDAEQTEGEKIEGDDSDNENDTHKISWILDGYEPDENEPKKTIQVADRPTAVAGTTVPSIHMTQKVEAIVDDKPGKISWIIDGHHEEEEVKEEQAKIATTTEDIEHISWIIDEHEYDGEITTISTPKPIEQEERISWIIDGNDNAENYDDKLRIADENEERLPHTTMPTQQKQSTYFLIMNHTVTLTNFTAVTITYGGDCVTTTTRPNEAAHPLDEPTSAENMLLSHGEQQLNETTHNTEISTTTQGMSSTQASSSTAPTSEEFQSRVWEDLFRKSSAVQEAELLDTFDAVPPQTMVKNGAKLNAANIDSFQDMQFLSLCEQVAQRLRNQDWHAGAAAAAVTPAPNAHFTSRGPIGGGGFPVTGETMKASAQFLYNPNFGMPTIPICFYITPANFRVVNQSPVWAQGFSNMQGGFQNMQTFPNMQGGFQNMQAGFPNMQSFQNMQGFQNSGQMGFSTPNGVFFVPQNFGTSGNFLSQMGVTAGSGQSNMPQVFSKNATPQKQQKQQKQQEERQQQQQFFCTYMQNNKMPSATGLSGLGSGGGSSSGGSGGSSVGGSLNTFSNANFKMRANAQNLSTDIIYASYTAIPAHLGHAEHFACASPHETGCYSGRQCILKSSWCNGVVDCPDGSDEAACRCIDRLASMRICDGYADCPMGEDELGCFGCTDATYSCYDGPGEFMAAHRSTLSMCYSAIEKCDGIMNCLNGRDELECNIIVRDVKDHMSHAVSSSSGFLFHNYRGEWYPVCHNAEKWAHEACANEADSATQARVSFREITLSGPFIEPTIVGQAHFPQSCQQRDRRDNLVDQAAYVECSTMACGRVRKKIKAPFRQKRSTRTLKTESSHKLGKGGRRRKRRDLSEGRIVGGSYSQPMQWPFVVAIYREGKFHCAGSIYSEIWIISAAHCVINYHKYYYEIRAGTLRRSSFASSAQVRTVTHIVTHQAYERRTMRNDLSLLRLDEPLMFNRWVKPICLPDMGRSTAGNDWIWGPKEDTLCTVVGWGAVREKGPGSDQLREVNVPIRKQCINPEDKKSENVCAGDVSGGRDACQGDSGGPLFCRSVNDTDEWYLAGIVSHGNGCARPGELGAYTRVALYLDWIEMAMQFPTKLQPQLMCPGYNCVWGGKRCIPKKRRCDRFVDCLGGEDEVGCVYNFIPDMVGSSKDNTTTTTTESDYYPEDEVKSPPPPCAPPKAIDGKARDAATGVDSVEVKEEDDDTKWNKTKAQMSFVTESNALTTILPETSTLETSTAETSTEDSTTELTSSTDVTSATEVTSTTEDSTSTTEFSTTDAPILETSTVTTTELSTSTTMESTSTEFNTETHATTQITRVGIDTEVEARSQTPFDSENLITTTTAKIARAEATTNAASINGQQRKFNETVIPGKFVCKRIPQIIEKTNRCDRLIDCEDGSDEDGCSCRDFLKGTLNVLICDGKADCDDLTDEENCGNCSSKEFLCPLTKSCIALEKRCDGIIDCSFKEDEKDCFALTNGREIILDADKRPTLKSVGIFSRNSHGKWRVVCTHEIPFFEEIANTAANVCTQLGFKSLKFYNITHFVTHDPIVPIHPDIYKIPKNIHTYFQAISKDRHHFSKAHNSFPTKNVDGQNVNPNKARIQYIERGRGEECTGLFVECEAKANNVEPLKTLSAIDSLAKLENEALSAALRPALETFGKPNVYVTPPPTAMVVVNKKEELINKMHKVIESRRNMSLLIDNKLHEAVEEMHLPWIVDVYVDGQLWCIGALVERYWVLVHESCQFGVRFNTNYISVLLGGGKTKRLRHRSAHEQIRRVDCVERVPRSDVLLYHLEKPAHFTHHVLPTFLPESSAHTTYDEEQQCIAMLHDENSGRIKTVAAVDERNDALCKFTDMSCYRLVERKPPRRILSELQISDEDFINLSDEVVLKDELEERDDDGDDYDDHSADDDAQRAMNAAVSRFTTCTQFGRRNASRNALEPIDQGILACRQLNGGWYPMALFDYNNTNCDSFKDAIALRSLAKVYGTIQNLIDEPKCEHSNSAPPCNTFRCALGECLEDEKICDGISDCHDGADEEIHMCVGRKKVCQPSELKCRTTYKCVPKTKFCDHIADCDDMTDEPTLCSCYTYLQATDPRKICDGVRNCWDKSDESPAICNCTDNHFRCGNTATECVPRDFVCDKEPDCPNGEDERYCYGIEYPKHMVTSPLANKPHTNFKHLPHFGQVIEQTYGVWHTKCFPRTKPPNVNEVRQLCKQLGFSPYKQPSFRLIDDATMTVAETNEWPDQRGRSFGREEDAPPLMERYRSATKAVVVSKFSPLSLNNELTLFLKPSRPIAEVARWNSTDSENCYRLEIKCM